MTISKIVSGSANLPTHATYKNGRDIELARISRRKWYVSNTAHAKAEIIRRKNELRVWFADLKAALKCSRCPEYDPCCLDFHHRDPKTKEISLSQASRNGWGRARTLTEIAKCDVLCANCHRKTHLSLSNAE